MVFIPERLTNLLQPADVEWFSVIKKAYRRLWNDWYMNADRNFTNSRNLKSPGYVKCLEWVSTIWTEFNPLMIKKSFIGCGIHSHSMIDGKVLIKYDDLHTMLKKFVVDKTTIHNHITDDMDLVDSEDLMNENDQAIFDLGEGEPSITDEDIEAIERLEQNLMNITDNGVQENHRTIERTLSSLIPNEQIISPILEVAPSNIYIELQAPQPVYQTSTPNIPTPNTDLANQDSTPPTQPKQRRRRRTKLEMIAARALEAESRSNRQ